MDARFGQKLNEALREAENQGVWTESPWNGFCVRLAFPPRDRFNKLMNGTRRIVTNPATKRPEESVDEEAVSAVYAKNVILDWKGLTPEILSSLLSMTTDRAKTFYTSPKEIADGLPYTEADAKDLMLKSISFDRWVANFIAEPANFAKSKEAEVDLKEHYTGLFQ